MLFYDFAWLEYRSNTYKGERMRYCRFLVIVFALITMGLLYATPPAITELGSFYTGLGSVMAFSSYGQYAYLLTVASDTGLFELVIYDLSDHSTPIRVNTISLSLNTSQSYNHFMKIEGQKLAIVCSRGIQIFSLSNPIAPDLLNSASFSGTIGGAVLEEDYLYILHDYYLKAYDITQTGAITAADSILINQAKSIFKVGENLLVGRYSGAYQIVNVSDPLSLSVPQTANTDPGDLCGIWHNRAYFAGMFGVSVYNISDIFNPSWLHSISSDLTPFLRNVHVLEGYLVMQVYVEVYHGTMDWTEIYDISMDQPQWVLSPDTNASDSFLSDSHSRLLLKKHGSISFLDLSLDNYMGPPIINDFITQLSASSQTAVLDMTYTKGLILVDSHDPNPTPTTLSIENCVYSDVAGTIMATSSCRMDSEGYSYSPNEIKLWDVGNPSNPSQIGSFFCAGTNCPTEGFSFSDTILLMVNEYGRVIAYNISNLQAPYLIGITESITRYDCIGILGNRVFCTGYRNGSNYLDEYSIDPLGTLDFVAEMSMQFQASKIVATPNRLTMAIWDQILVYDTTIPGAPALLTTINLSSQARDFHIKDNLLIVLRTGIVEIYSLLPFGQSALMASHSVPNAASKLALSDDIVLVKASNRLIYLDCSEVFALETENPDEGLLPAYSMNVYPNPFSGDATISIDLPAGSDRFAENPIAKLDVYNLRGQKIRTLINNEAISQTRPQVWDGCDDQGSMCTNGVYLLKLQVSGRKSSIKKITLLR